MRDLASTLSYRNGSDAIAPWLTSGAPALERRRRLRPMADVANTGVGWLAAISTNRPSGIGLPHPSYWSFPCRRCRTVCRSARCSRTDGSALSPFPAGEAWSQGSIRSQQVGPRNISHGSRERCDGDLETGKATGSLRAGLCLQYACNCGRWRRPGRNVIDLDPRHVRFKSATARRVSNTPTGSGWLKKNDSAMVRADPIIWQWAVACLRWRGERDGVAHARERPYSRLGLHRMRNGRQAG